MTNALDDKRWELFINGNYLFGIETETPKNNLDLLTPYDRSDGWLFGGGNQWGIFGQQMTLHVHLKCIKAGNCYVIATN